MRFPCAGAVGISGCCSALIQTFPHMKVPQTGFQCRKGWVRRAGARGAASGSHPVTQSWGCPGPLGPSLGRSGAARLPSCPFSQSHVWVLLCTSGVVSQEGRSRSQVCLCWRPGLSGSQPSQSRTPGGVGGLLSPSVIHTVTRNESGVAVSGDGLVEEVGFELKPGCLRG